MGARAEICLVRLPGAGITRLARPAPLDGSVDDGSAAWPCWRFRAELRLRDGPVGRCGARAGHGLRIGRARHGPAIALLGSCVARLHLAAEPGPVCGARSAAGRARSRVGDAYGVVPALACQSPDSYPGPSDADDGGGSGPDRPPVSPEPPDGGVPLPDANPSRTRLRDHGSPKIRSVPRWRSREPERRHAPVPPNQ